jgi:site-specific recombinase XerD
MADALLTVSQAIDRFLFAAGLEVKATTIADYEKCLRSLRAIDKPIGAVTIDDLRLVYAQLRGRTARYINPPTRPAQSGGLSVYTLHKHVRAWKRFFHWLVEEQVITANPAQRLKRPKLPKTPPRDLRFEDLMRLLSEAQRSGLRDYAIVCVLAGTAIRVGGLAGLRLDDIDLDARVILVREKGDKARRVHLPERAVNALRRYIDEERPDGAGPLVFIGLCGPLTTGGIYQVLKRLARCAGVTGRFNPHAFRHGFARVAIQRGANPRELQEILGHEDVRTTLAFYLIYYENEVHRRHDEVSWLPPEGEG